VEEDKERACGKRWREGELISVGRDPTDEKVIQRKEKGREDCACGKSIRM